MFKYFVMAITLCSTIILQAEDSIASTTIKPMQTDSKNESIVGGISLFVNGEPITMYAIEHIQNTLHVDKIRATDMLVMEKLKDSEIKRLKIEVTDAQLESQISQIAQQNGMNLDQFYAAVMREGMNLSEYRTKLKEQILTQELMRKILFSSNVGQEDELRKYYNEHTNEFIIPKKIKGIKFVSNDKKTLEAFIKHGVDSNIPDSIAHSKEVLEISSLPPQIADIFLTSSERNFTQVFESSENSFVTFYIEQKLESEQVEFEKAKNYIAQKLIANNQEKILNDYFERVRSRSKIVFIR